MSTINFGQGDVNVIASIWTMTLYEQEFDSDIIQDVYKKVVIRKEDVNDEDVLAVVDFRNVNWTSLMRALWACIKTADDATPGFKEWSKTVGDIDIMAVNDQLMPILERGLFRAGADITE